MRREIKIIRPSENKDNTERIFKDIPLGTYFTGIIGDNCSLFVHAFEKVIDLKNPINTWTGNGFIVRNYKPVSNVSIAYDE